MKRIALLMLSLLMLVSFASCEMVSDGDSEQSTVSVDVNKGIDFTSEKNEVDIDMTKIEGLENYKTENPIAAIKIEGYGTVVVELYPDIAPNTVNNFISLIRKGFYDNNTIHRSVPGFMIQGGDPKGDGTGGPGYSIYGEFTSNGFRNDLKHTEGVISMARRSSPKDSAGSQFFIMLGDASYLDGEYAAFGKVISGMDIVKKLADKEKVSNINSGKLSKNVKIERAVVDTNGKEYPEPEIIES